MEKLITILSVVGILFAIFSLFFVVFFLFSKINKKIEKREVIKESKKETSNSKKLVYINYIIWVSSAVFSIWIFYKLTGFMLSFGVYGGPLFYFILILPIYLAVTKLKYFKKLVKDDEHKLETLAISLSTLWVVIVGLVIFLWNKIF